MGHTLEQFAAQCHRILKADPGPGGRTKVCALLREVLTDQEFIAKYVNDNTPNRQVIYEDSELGFCILAHHHKGASETKPHDHGPAWAIYGQVDGVTEMTDWELLEPASEDKPGKVRKTNTYELKPGMAYLYNEGDLHSPRREAATKLIRIEGKNMDKVRRFAYQAA
ncbi:MAG: hypothetical protein GTO40_19795 [Deltaproteobacteria bacterium]|nr:hypothetical protein [Deltaproteobacteria bacterium]